MHFEHLLYQCGSTECTVLLILACSCIAPSLQPNAEVRLFPARKSLVSDIPAGDGKINNLFLQCTVVRNHSIVPLYFVHGFKVVKGKLILFYFILSCSMLNFFVPLFCLIQYCMSESFTMCCTFVRICSENLLKLKISLDHVAKRNSFLLFLSIFYLELLFCFTGILLAVAAYIIFFVFLD
jgi:hypothetical protein